MCLSVEYCANLTLCTIRTSLHVDVLTIAVLLQAAITAACDSRFCYRCANAMYDRYAGVPLD
jgi:hypothetical protein